MSDGERGDGADMVVASVSEGEGVVLENGVSNSCS